MLQKALALGKKPIVVINKVDKPNCRPEVVNEQVFDLDVYKRQVSRSASEVNPYATYAIRFR